MILPLSPPIGLVPLSWVRLWDWRRRTEAAVLATTSGMPASVQATTVMSRACCFAPHRPDMLFSVQSGPRGKAYVTQWKYGIKEGREGIGSLSCVAEPVKVACVSSNPVTSMSVRGDGTRLAVASVEGSVLVYRLPGFAKVSSPSGCSRPSTPLYPTPGTMSCLWYESLTRKLSHSFAGVMYRWRLDVALRIVRERNWSLISLPSSFTYISTQLAAVK